ncbi:MAG: hypothetical protein WCT04_11225 [Planctomycetota bacterium]
MGTTYKSEAQRTCFKQHTCLTCSATYRYRFTRKVQATGETPEAAQVASANALQTALTTTVDLRACPSCGLMQPEMVGQERSEQHGCMVGMTIVLFIALWILYGFGFAHYRVLSYVALAAGLLIVLKNMGSALHNPNSNLARNKEQAINEVEAGMTVLVEPGYDPGLDAVATNVSPGMKVAFMLLLASLPLFGGAELYRLANGWSYNDHCSPPVAGPGEMVKFYSGDSISGIKGYWNSQSKVMVKNSVELGLSGSEFTTLSHSDFGSGTIRSKSSERDKSSDVFVEFLVPTNPQLEGKTAVLDIVMIVKSPQYQSSGVWTVKAQTFTYSKSIAIVASGAGKKYLQLWWGGMIGGLVALVVAGLVLSSIASKLKNGLPTQLIPIPVISQETGT